jgi:hypothetical protein
MSDSTLNAPPSPATGALVTRNPRSSQPAESCPALTLAGQPCRMRPTAATGRCMAHSDAAVSKARSSRGGSLKAAHAALAAQKAALVAKYGIQADLPALESVEALGAYLSSIAARVEACQLTPAQANSLVGVVKMAKDLMGLSLDIRLAEQLDAQESR